MSGKNLPLALLRGYKHPSKFNPTRKTRHPMSVPMRGDGVPTPRRTNSRNASAMRSALATPGPLYTPLSSYTHHAGPLSTRSEYLPPYPHVNSYSSGYVPPHPMSSASHMTPSTMRSLTQTYDNPYTPPSHFSSRSMSAASPFDRHSPLASQRSFSPSSISPYTPPQPRRSAFDTRVPPPLSSYGGHF